MRLIVVRFVFIILTVFVYEQIALSLENNANLNITLEDNQNLYTENDYAKIHTTDLTVLTLFNADQWSFSGTIGASHQMNLQNSSTLTNTVLMASKKAETAFGYAFGLILPTDQDLVQSTRFRGAATTKGSLGTSFNILNKKMDVKYSLLVTRNSHEFTTDSDGHPLMEYIFKNRIESNLAITKTLSFGVLFDYVNGLTYEQNPREKFLSNVEFDYMLNEASMISLGVSTDGNAKKANNDDSNIKFFNENTSVIHTGISLSL